MGHLSLKNMCLDWAFVSTKISETANDFIKVVYLRLFVINWKSKTDPNIAISLFKNNCKAS